MEKISRRDRVRNEEVFRRFKQESNSLLIIKRREVNRIGHILHRNCLLKYVIEGNVEGRIGVTGRRGRRRKKLLDYPKEVRGEILHRTPCRRRFGRDYGPVVGQTTEDDCVGVYILKVHRLIL